MARGRVAPFFVDLEGIFFENFHFAHIGNVFPAFKADSAKSEPVEIPEMPLQSFERSQRLCLADLLAPTHRATEPRQRDHLATKSVGSSGLALAGEERFETVFLLYSVARVPPYLERGKISFRVRRHNDLFGLLLTNTALAITHELSQTQHAASANAAVVASTQSVEVDRFTAKNTFRALRI